jgi:beta-glucanase (GH16 family)
MRLFYLFCLAAALGLGACNRHLSPAARYEQEGYRLVWADEFNKDGQPDTTNWDYERGFVRNEEDQWYQPENARCTNGLLVIEARKEEQHNTIYKAGSAHWWENRPVAHYTSASLLTKGKHAWRYGRFEMRARIDTRPGLWPAWWTMGVDKTWPAGGEIDMMEYYRKKLLANIACIDKKGEAEWISHTLNTDSLGKDAWASRFHTWRMDWTETGIALYVDGYLLTCANLEQLVNKDGTGFNPFRQPHYMLLNLAIGGNSGGDPSATAFPGRFEVDYVRVYQKK